MHKHFLKIAIIVVAVLIVGSGMILFFTYTQPQSTPFITTLQRVLHLPAARVGTTFISLSDFAMRRDAARHFYENQNFADAGIRVDFATEDGQKRLAVLDKQVFDKMIENAVIAQIAAEKDIDVSDEEVAMALDRSVAQSDQEVAKERAALYGWSVDEFGTYVVRDELLRAKLEQDFDAHNPITDAMRTTIAQAQKTLADGRTFEDVATKYSEGNTAAAGGLLGTFARGQLTPALETFAFGAKEGDVSDVIETPFGLHIIRVDSVERDENDVSLLVTLHQIIVKRKTFAQYIDDALAATHVSVYAPGYAWDAEHKQLIFVDNPALTQFEERLYEGAVVTPQE